MIHLAIDWYDYNSINKNLYGTLYNWSVVNSGKLCPDGWHIPTDAEWAALAEYLGGESNAGGFLKSISADWKPLNNKATNYAGFYGLPGGSSADMLGAFTGKGLYGMWWSSTIDYSVETADGLIVTQTTWCAHERLIRNGIMTKGGNLHFLSCRCIKTNW